MAEKRLPIGYENFKQIIHKDFYFVDKSIFIYDILEKANYCGFYDKMIGFVRTIFESALKTNNDLEFSVITGCLRITKKHRYRLNNLAVIWILSLKYSNNNVQCMQQNCLCDLTNFSKDSIIDSGHLKLYLL